MNAFLRNAGFVAGLGIALSLAAIGCEQAPAKPARVPVPLQVPATPPAPDSIVKPGVQLVPAGWTVRVLSRDAAKVRVRIEQPRDGSPGSASAEKIYAEDLIAWYLGKARALGAARVPPPDDDPSTPIEFAGPDLAFRVVRASSQGRTHADVEIFRGLERAPALLGLDAAAP